MYGALWRSLPGPWPVKLIFVVALVAAVLFALIVWIFPWLDGLLAPSPDDVTVGLQAMLGRPVS